MDIGGIGHCFIRHRKTFVCVRVCACVCMHILSYATSAAIPQMPSTSLAPFLEKLSHCPGIHWASQGAACLCFSDAWVTM